MPDDLIATSLAQQLKNMPDFIKQKRIKAIEEELRMDPLSKELEFLSEEGEEESQQDPPTWVERKGIMPFDFRGLNKEGQMQTFAGPQEFQDDLMHEERLMTELKRLTSDEPAWTWRPEAMQRDILDPIRQSVERVAGKKKPDVRARKEELWQMKDIEGIDRLLAGKPW